MFSQKLNLKSKLISALRFATKPEIKTAIAYIVISSILAYFVSTKWSPIAIPIAPAYFLIIIVGGLAVELGIFFLVAKLAKLENRSFENILFFSASANLLNSLFSVARLPFYESHKWVTFVMAGLVAVAIWLLVKRIFSLKNKQVWRLFLWFALVMFGVVIILGFLGNWLLSKYFIVG